MSQVFFALIVGGFVVSFLLTVVHEETTTGLFYKILDFLTLAPYHVARIFSSKGDPYA
jgi:hypothetical protein